MNSMLVPTRGKASNPLEKILQRRLLPPVVMSSPGDAVRLANAFLGGGQDVMEITFRDPKAPECVTAIRNVVPEMVIGAGTLLSEESLVQAIEAGAQFGVTPGFNPSVINAAKERDFFLIPGVATPGELEQAIALGARLVKVFPIEPLGGIAYLKALSGPYLQTGVKLIPMGGIKMADVPRYISVPIVGALGGSWMAPQNLIERGDWEAIARTAGELLVITESVGLLG